MTRKDFIDFLTDNGIKFEDLREKDARCDFILVYARKENRPRFTITGFENTRWNVKFYGGLFKEMKQAVLRNECWQLRREAL